MDFQTGTCWVNKRGIFTFGKTIGSAPKMRTGWKGSGHHFFCKRRFNEKYFKSVQPSFLLSFPSFQSLNCCFWRVSHSGGYAGRIELVFSLLARRREGCHTATKAQCQRELVWLSSMLSIDHQVLLLHATLQHLAQLQVYGSCSCCTKHGVSGHQPQLTFMAQCAANKACQRDCDRTQTQWLWWVVGPHCRFRPGEIMVVFHFCLDVFWFSCHWWSSSIIILIIPETKQIHGIHTSWS